MWIKKEKESSKLYSISYLNKLIINEKVYFQWIPTDPSSPTDKSNKNVSLLAGFGAKDVVDDVIAQADEVSMTKMTLIVF